jgi:hypothetical protein
VVAPGAVDAPPSPLVDADLAIVVGALMTAGTAANEPADAR